MKKLKKIFKHYKKEYKLKTKLKIDNTNIDTYYNSKENVIVISALAIEVAKYIEHKSGESREKEKILTMLHEIGHAVDYKKNKKKVDMEKQLTHRTAYLYNREYHNTRPYEIRTENFAKKELSKWYKEK